MRSNYFSLGLLSVMSLTGFTAASVCESGPTIIPDCCWKDVDACTKKLGFDICDGENADQGDNYCSVNGVTTQECDADCCSVSKKIGIACPPT